MVKVYKIMEVLKLGLIRLILVLYLISDLLVELKVILLLMENLLFLRVLVVFIIGEGDKLMELVIL